MINILISLWNLLGIIMLLGIILCAALVIASLVVWLFKTFVDILRGKYK